VLKAIRPGSLPLDETPPVTTTRTVAQRVALRVALIFAIVVPVFGFIAFRGARAVALKEIVRSQHYATAAAMATVDRMLADAAQDIQLIAEDGATEQRMENQPSGHPAGGLWYQKELDQMVALSGPWQHVIIADLSGTIVISEDGKRLGQSVLDEAG